MLIAMELSLSVRCIGCIRYQILSRLDEKMQKMGQTFIEVVKHGFHRTGFHKTQFLIGIKYKQPFLILKSRSCIKLKAPTCLIHLTSPTLFDAVYTDYFHQGRHVCCVCPNTRRHGLSHFLSYVHDQHTVLCSSL